MLRNDYILRAIEQFAQLIARLLKLVAAGKTEEVGRLVGQSVEELVGLDVAAVCARSESFIVSRLMAGGTLDLVRVKGFLLVRLLQEAGDNGLKEGSAAVARACHLKALNLLLALQSHAGDAVAPEYVPAVDELIARLRDEPLPGGTLVALMRHHETLGEYARAEDALFRLLDVAERRPPALELGNAFFRRLLACSDEELLRGNLPRAEVESGLEEIAKMFAASAARG